MTFFAGDRELLEGFRRGDRVVLGDVYRHYYPQVARVLRLGFNIKTGEGPVSIAGLASQFEVESACHEVFLRAFGAKARLAYDGVRSYRNYLFRIARNWRIDQFRRWHHEVGIDESTFELREERTPAEYLILREELKGLVDAYVAELGSSDRLFYEARYLRGASQRDAAAEQGLTRIQGRRIEARIKVGLLRMLRSHGYGGVP